MYQTPQKIPKALITFLLVLSTYAAGAQCTMPTATVVNNTSCISGNGSITANGPTPLANFEFSKDGGTTFQPGNIFNNLAPGNYAIVARATDLSCVSAVASFTVTNAPVAVATPTTTNVNPTSCITPDGSITIAGGPTPLASYEFSINNGLSFQAGTVFSSLSAGSYQVMARSIATGCVSAATNVTLSNPAIVNPAATAVSPTSCTAPNGTVTFTAPTPLANYEFSIDNATNFQAGSAFASLPAGSYHLRAKDISTGCISAEAVIVLSNPVIAAPTLTIANITSCGSNNGSITVTTPTPLASYEFSKDIGVTYQASNVFTALAAGNYGIMVRQLATGCTSAVNYAAIANATVTPPTPTVTSVNPTNCTTPNGSITVATPTPLTNYEFSIDNGVTYQSSNIFNGLAGGAYQVRARALATNCVSAALNRTLTNPVVASPAAAPASPTACNLSNGSMTVTPNPNAPANFQYSNDNGATFQASNVFSNLAPGTYQVRTRLNSSGCLSAAINSTVSNPVATSPTLTSTNNTICIGTPNGSITVTAPIAGYEFSNDNGVTFQASNVFNNLAAGTYPMRVRNTTTTCSSAVVNRVITLAPAAVTTPVTSFTNPTSCSAPNGSITVTTPSPAANYEFSINNGVTFQSSNVFNGLANGTYQVVARLISTGCKSVASARVLTAPAVTAPTLASINNTICSGAPSGSITVSAPTPLTSYQFSKDNGATFQAGATFNNLAAGTYLVRVKQTSNGCISAAVSRTVTNAPAAVATPGVAVTQPTSCATPNGSVTVTPSPNVPANFQYSKDNGVTFQSSNVFTGLAAGAYQFRTRLISTGCMSAAVSSTLTAPAVAAPTTSALNNTNCSGTPNGSITVSAPAPAANFEFSKDNGLTYQAGNNVFTNLAAGTYTIRVRSIATGCVSPAGTRAVSNAFAAVVAPAVTSADPLNCAPDDGVITVTAPVPLTNYLFSIDNGVTFQSSNVFTGLKGATYKVRVQLVTTGCISAVVNRVLTPAPAPAMPAVTKADATTCAGDGSLTVTSPSPLGNYMFSKDNGATFQSAPSFTNLSAGIYQIVAKSNANGCLSPVSQQAMVTSAVCPEVCNNGTDDDKDGLIDGMDPDCACDAGQFNAGCSTTCEYQFTSVAFSIKQVLSTPASGITVYQTPMVGDIDIDGVNEILLMSTNNYDLSGTGPGASTSFRWSRDVAVFNGQTGALESTIPTVDANGVGYDVAWSGFPAIALANVDDDPQSEIFVLSGQSTANTTNGDDSYIFCYGADGTFKWKSNVRYGYATMTYRFGAAINLADFNHDGIAEIYVYDQVFNARTGVLLVQGGGARGLAIGSGDIAGTVAIGVTSHPVAADVLPASSNLELVCGRTVYSVNLTNTAGTAGNNMSTFVNAPALSYGGGAAAVRDGYTSVADMDADGFLDVVVTWGDALQAMLYVWNPRTGTVMSKVDATQTASAFAPGVAFLGNFDSDCGIEVGFCMSSQIKAYDYAPTTMIPKWSLTTTDASGITGLTLFDFNQDGKAEIVYRDMDNIRLIDAATGVDIATPIPCESGTGLEMPVVADVKGNGTAQICVTCNTVSNMGTVKVFASASEPWAPAREVWNQQGYHVTNINDDLSVPQMEYNVATALSGAGCTGCKNTPYNNFLQQATYRTQEGCVQFPAADAVASNASVVYGCDTSVVSYTITNNADVAKLPAGTPVAFYNGDPAQAGAVLIGRDSLPADLAPGAFVNLNQGFILTPYGPSFNLYIAVNDTGATTTPTDFPITSIPECNYTNNITAGLLVTRPTAGANPPTICQLGSVQLQATGIDAGHWTADATNPDTAIVIAQPDSLNTVVGSFTTGGAYRFFWNFNGCVDTVLVTVNTIPDAGPDKTVDCFTTDAAIMEATGTASWTLLGTSAGTATISDPTSPTTIINNFSVNGTYTVTWTDSIGCSDTAQIFAFVACTPLPLDLLSFSAVKSGPHQVLLRWKTGSEHNTDRFFVEKSRNARTWNAIGTLKAAGTSMQEKVYSFYDEKSYDGINYYRVRMLSLDGSYKLSETKQVYFSDAANAVVVAPNPATAHTTLRFARPLGETLAVQVWNSMGRLVTSLVFPAGTQTYDLDLATQPKGVYLINMEGAGIREQVKLILR